jgi:hypothetical protein
MTMTLIETKTLDTAVSTVSFTSIPQTFTDLLLLASTRSSRTGAAAFIGAYINGTTTNQSNRRLAGDGSTASSSGESNNWSFISASAIDTASTFSNTSIYVPNYAGSTAKSFSLDSVSENNGTTARQIITAGLWNSTTAITSLQLIDPNGNFVVGSVLSLYGILKGSDGIVTVS